MTVWAVYQKLFNEKLENKSIMLWFSPKIIFSYSKKNDIERFFLNSLKSESYGYSFELGIEYKKFLKIGLLLNQLMNTERSSTLKSPSLRITINNKLKKTKILDLNQQVSACEYTNSFNSFYNLVKTSLSYV